MMSSASDAPVITGYTIQDDISGFGFSVTISGTNFGSYRRLAAVTFNGVRAYSMVNWTNEYVTWKMPACVTSGPLVVYNWENTPSNSVHFEAPETTSTVADESGARPPAKACGHEE